MRFFLLSTIFLLAGLRAFCQLDIGLGGGAAINSLQTDISNRPQQALHSVTGLFFDLPVSYSIPLTKKGPAGYYGVTLQTEFIFIQKGYALNRTDTLQDLDQQFRNNYVQVPLSALLFFKNKTGCIQLGAGFYVGYWASSRIQGGMPNLFNTALDYPATYDFDQQTVFDDRKDNRWEEGWSLQGRFAVNIQATTALFLAVHYFQSVTDQQKAYMTGQIPRYNNTLAFSLGIQKQFVW